MRSHQGAVLVLDADSNAGLACVQSLGRMGLEIHAAVRAAGSLTARSRWCHRLYLLPPAEPAAAAVEWLLGLDAQVGFVLVVPTTEASLRWLRRLSPMHAVRRKAVLPGDGALDTALDKQQTYALAERLGLPVVPTRRLSQGEEIPPPGEEGWPRVLKPVSSKVVMGERLVTLGAAVVRDAAARARELGAWLPFTAVLEQAWVPGRGLGVEVVYAEGRLQWSFIHERLHEWPLTGGASTLRRAAAPQPAVLEMSCRLLDALDWHGAAMVEWRRSDQGTLHLMEINPRLWGSLPLTIAAGVDVPRALLALARREAPPPAPRWRVGVTARKVSEDLRWLWANARADPNDPLLLTEPTRVALLGWVRGVFWGERWDGWCWRDPAVAWHELGALVRRPFGMVLRRLATGGRLLRVRHRQRRVLGGMQRPVRRVLFLCLGNVCRSPFAAAVARLELRGLAVDSAGLQTRDGRPSPIHVVQAAHALGVDLHGARSRRATQETLAAADLILVMDLANLQLLGELFPEALGRTTLLGLFGPGPAEIADPDALPLEPTRRVLLQIRQAVTGLAGWLNGGACK